MLAAVCPPINYYLVTNYCDPLRIFQDVKIHCIDIRTEEGAHLGTIANFLNRASLSSVVSNPCSEESYPE